MPQIDYQTPEDALGFIQEWRVSNSFNSPRVDGKLVLRNNPYLLLAGRLGPQRFSKGFDSWCWKKAYSGADVPPGALSLFREQQLHKTCYSKLRGKLYRGSASLGVTLATVKQSREMINTRYSQLTQKAEAAAADLLSWESRGRNSGPKYLERLAGFHLEVIFGWTPLVQDIHAAATSVIQLADEHDFVSVSANNDGAVYQSAYDTWVLQCRVAYSTAVRITNPNRWLAERAGLLNPAVVAWDIVPWSFVVNMFVNTGQLVQSITDFAGLQFDDMHATVTKKYHAVRQAPEYGVYSSMRGVDKRRAPSPLPPVPSLTFRLPDANWDTAATAASLFTQRFGAVARYVKPRWTALRSLHRLRKRGPLSYTD